MGYDEVYRELAAGKAGSGLPCAEVRSLLGELGFRVKDGARGGHKVITHPHLPGFTTAAYNCKSGNGDVDRNYLGSILRVLRQHEADIKKHLGEADEKDDPE